MSDEKEYHLNINKKDYKWDKPIITGAEIKKLAGSPPDWVVNEIVDQPGEDPEVGDGQEERLDDPDHKREKFITRKPTTSPG